MIISTLQNDASGTSIVKSLPLEMGLGKIFTFLMSTSSAKVVMDPSGLAMSARLTIAGELLQKRVLNV